MNKAEFARAAAVELGITQTKAAEQFETFMSLVDRAVMEDGKLSFGPWSWKKKVSPERTCRDPRNGTLVQVAQKVFCVSKKQME